MHGVCYQSKRHRARARRARLRLWVVREANKNLKAFLHAAFCTRSETALRLAVRAVPLRRIFRRGELALVLVHCCSTRCRKLPRPSTEVVARPGIPRALRVTSATTTACGRVGMGPAAVVVVGRGRPRAQLDAIITAVFVVRLGS